MARLGLAEQVTEYLDPLVWVPAAGQGILGIQCRAGDSAERLLAAIDHPPTRTAITAERAVLRRLGSGCRTPVGVYARELDGVLALRGVLVSPDGRHMVIAEREGQPDEAGQIGSGLAEELIRRGADIYQVVE